MVKSGRIAKTSSVKGSEDTTTSSDKPAEKEDIEMKVEEEANENGETVSKEKKTKSAKKTPKKPEKTESKDENGTSNEESNTKENGEVPKKDSKVKSAKKSTKMPAKQDKPKIEGERKSSRPRKPVAKEGGDEQAYEVEKIVDSRVVRGITLYQVRWKGFSRGDDTWEEEEALENCKDILQHFKKEHPGGKAAKRKASKSPSKKSPKKKLKSSEPQKQVKKEDYEVEEILEARTKGNKKEFKVRWKGYGPSDDTWEPEKNLSCQDLIKAYEEKHKDDVEEVEKKPEKVKKAPKKSKTPAKKVKKSKKK